MFRVLGEEDIRQIAERSVRPLIAAARDQGVELRVSADAIAAIAAEAYDPRQGARMVRRVVERRLRSPLASVLLAAGRRQDRCIEAVRDAHGNVELRECASS